MNRIATLDMSLPPSANDLTVPIARGRMVRSRSYSRWIQAWLPLGMQDIERLPKHAPAWVRIEAALTRQRDLDNVCNRSMTCCNAWLRYPMIATSTN